LFPPGQLSGMIGTLLLFLAFVSLVQISCQTSYVILPSVVPRPLSRLVFAFIFSASEHHDRVFSKTEVGLQMLYNDLPKILSKLLYAYIHPPLAADEVSGLAFQLVTANFVMKMMV